MNRIYKELILKKNGDYDERVLFIKNKEEKIKIVCSLFEQTVEIEDDIKFDKLKITKFNTGDIYFKIEKLGDGKSGALIYKLIEINNNNKIKNKEVKVLKIYKEKGNLERNIREISVYCTFEKIKDLHKEEKLPFPKILEMGFITKESDIYPETPYIITELAKGISLTKFLKNYEEYNIDILYNIMLKIIENLLNINKIIKFSHEDLHPDNIMVDIIDKEEINVTFIDFDLTELGDLHYTENTINPIKRPYSRRLTRCVPGKMNELIEIIFKKNNDIYKNFLKRFDKCNFFSSIFKSTKEFNKIKLDRVVIIYYL